MLIQDSVVGCGIVMPLTAAAVLFSASPAMSSPSQSDRDFKVIYVDDDAPYGGDGLSWSSAFQSLRDALTFATDPANAVTDIRVAQGVYKPDHGMSVDATFRVPSSVAVRGGYAGLTGRDPDEQDWKRFESILSGDLLGNDPPLGTFTFSLFTDNSRHVVTISNGGSNVLEGLVIASGRSDLDGVGAGMNCMGGTQTLTHCTFRGNWGYFGGGVRFQNCNATVLKCIFSQNRAFSGGGIRIQTGTIIVEQCMFNGNSATGTGAGAGLVAANGSAKIVDCDFVANKSLAGAHAGAIASSASTVVERCRFIQNSADEGGAIRGDLICVDCEFAGNLADFSGACRENGTYVRCTFRMNSAFTAGGVHESLNSGLASATFIQCVFDSNSAPGDGGAVDSGGTFINCEFRNNRSWAGSGGAVHVKFPMTMINCVVDGNIADDEGAIHVKQHQMLTLINSTVVNNISTRGLGGIAVDGQAFISNSIVTGNNGGQIGGRALVEYSCIQGGWRGPGRENIDADPQFVNALGPDGAAGTADDDLRLQSGSPCIDMGDNTALPPDTFDLDDDGNNAEPLPVDLDDLRRVINDHNTPNTGFPPGPPNAPMVDCGAYEFVPPPLVGDINGDGLVNVNDLLAVINAWGICPVPGICSADIAPPNGDGVVNGYDLIALLFNWGGSLTMKAAAFVGPNSAKCIPWNVNDPSAKLISADR